MKLDPIEIIKNSVRQPSVSTDPSYAEGMEGAREYVKKLLEGLGFEVEIIKTPGHPVVLAERGKGHSDWPHILIYGHYDVQPADPFDLWQSPPFESEIRGDRLYGRGSADNKGPTAVQIAALSCVLEAHPDLPLRITWMIEGEEEIGGPSMPWFLENYGDRLKDAEVLIVSDTGCPDPEHLAITTGLRGLTSLELTLTGPNKDLHSGVFGGAVVNPVAALTQICASLHHEDGTVNVPGFYDKLQAPEDWERQQLANMPETEASLKALVGVESLSEHSDMRPLEAIRFGSTLEFNGIGGGYQGEGEKTIIPSKAFVKITCRLVPDQDPFEIQKCVAAAIRERCPKGVTLELKLGHGGYAYGVNPVHYREVHHTKPNTASKAFTIAHEQATKIWGREPIYVREGGSIPVIADLCKLLESDCLMIGLFTPMDNLHSPNESFHLDIVRKATELYERLFTGLGTETK